MNILDRREFLRLMAVAAAGGSIFPSVLFAEAGSKRLTKPIPSTQAPLPVIGMGTWITFNVGTNVRLRAARTEVLREFFKHGGGMIDSSPMYDSSEAVIGHGLSRLGFPETLFSATKVWTSSAEEGLKQIEQSRRLWGIRKFALFQVHNLENWKAHLKTLFKMKDKGELGYVGITTSHGRRHDEMAKLMREYPLDFVQLTYNVVDRSAEPLLDLAGQRKIAVIANRPFDGGALLDKHKSKPLPPWAGEAGCSNWPEFLLKFIVSHPAVTCAIPATSKVAHMTENMGAGTGKLPDATTREKIAKHVAAL